VEHRGCQEMDRRFTLREVDVLALARPAAMVERGEDGGRAEARRDGVGVGAEGAGGRAAGPAAAGAEARARGREGGAPRAIGARSGQPQRRPKPVIECARLPNPAYLASGPVCPMRHVLNITSDGFTVRRCSYPSPSASMVPVVYASATTSAQRTRSRNTARPA